MAVDLEERPGGVPLAELYEADEVAWLDLMAGLAAAGRAGELDLVNLQEYLESMSRRDKRSVNSRLTLLLRHLLKWEHQPGKRGVSWLLTIREQRRVLAADFADSRTLRRHADGALPAAYADAREDAALETGLPLAAFPPDCPYTLDAALSAPLDGDPTAAE